jgi:hypothetical protein
MADSLDTLIAQYRADSGLFITAERWENIKMLIFVGKLHPEHANECLLRLSKLIEEIEHLEE